MSNIREQYSCSYTEESKYKYGNIGIFSVIAPFTSLEERVDAQQRGRERDIGAMDMDIKDMDIKISRSILQGICSAEKASVGGERNPCGPGF